MKNKVIIGVIGTMISAGSLSAFDYDFYGGAYAFSKVGFNNTLDTANGKYPTDSWASIGLEANVKGSFLPGFTYGLGGMISAPVWDKAFGGQYPSRAYINGTVRNSMSNNLDATSNNYYSLSMAYLGYEFNVKGLDIGVKAGRYLDHGLDWFSGSSEGAHAWLGINKNMKVQLNFVNRRGLAFNQWFYDFYSIGKDGTTYKNGYFIVGAFDVNYENWGVKPQIWYHANDYFAPGVNAFYQYKGDSFSAKTSLYTLFVLSQRSEATIYKYMNQTDKKLGTLLILQEDMAYNNWDFGVGIWKNFGAPSGGKSQIGSHGSLAKIDVWTSTAFGPYDPWALTDVTSEDAFTGWLYGGQRLGDFKWEVLGRITTSKASNEQSLALTLGYNVTKQIALGAKLEWFNDISKASENILNKSVRNDRSHLFLTAAYNW